MAIYHFSGTIISRSQGRSAVACAAYRSAERLQDARYAKVHDYTQKKDVVHTAILLPEGAPAWMADREQLWNAVEAAEKRKDAQLAREFHFALPRELTLLQNITLAREFVQQEFVNKGMIVDLCIHNDKMPNGEWQPHAHIMLTLREVTAEGFDQKVRAWNAKDNLLVWRAAWAEVANRHLFLQGHDQRIDHRTLKAQGIALEPQYKIGASVARERLARLEDHQRIARENGEKLLADPIIALTAITRQQSTFTHQDLARFVNRHTADAEQFQAVYDTLKGHEQMVFLGHDSQGRERFTTQALLALETQMVKRAEHLAARSSHPVSATYQQQALNSRPLSLEQQLAFTHVVSEGGLKTVVGYAGSGKSYLLGAAREAWEAAGYRVEGVALAGIAAENLEAGSGIESRTLASRCYYWDKGEQLLTANTILVVDEAGMIGSRQFDRLLAEAEKQHAKVVLVGDPSQLQAIEAGAAFRVLHEHCPGVVLSDIRRQQQDWQRQATRELATGNTAAALAHYAAHDHVHAFETQAAAKQGLVVLWNDARLSQPEQTQLMLAYTRDDVRELNQLARGLRREQGELGVDHTLLTARGQRDFAEQDRVYFVQNDRELGVKNGTLGTLQNIHDGQLVVQLDAPAGQSEKARTVRFSIERYAHLDHGYAATLHKSQGVTVNRSYVLASKYMDSHATYVGLSRHRDSVDVFYGRDEFANERALAQSVGRERSKDVTLDYTQGFAEQRGFAQAMQQAHALQQACGLLAAQPALEPHSRYEQLLQDAAKRYTALEKPPHLPAREDFKAFKAAFEAKHPEQAKAMQEAIRPRHEKLALASEKQFQQLEAAIEKSSTPRYAREQLAKYAVSVAKQPEVMAYLTQHNQALSEKIQTVATAYEKALGWDRSR